MNVGLAIRFGWTPITIPQSPCTITYPLLRCALTTKYQYTLAKDQQIRSECVLMPAEESYNIIGAWLFSNNNHSKVDLSRSASDLSILLSHFVDLTQRNQQRVVVNLPDPPLTRSSPIPAGCTTIQVSVSSVNKVDEWMTDCGHPIRYTPISARHCAPRFSSLTNLSYTTRLISILLQRYRPVWGAKIYGLKSEFREILPKTVLQPASQSCCWIDK